MKTITHDQLMAVRFWRDRPDFYEPGTLAHKAATKVFAHQAAQIRFKQKLDAEAVGVDYMPKELPKCKPYGFSHYWRQFKKIINPMQFIP